MAIEFSFHPAQATRDSNNVGGVLALGAQVGAVVTVADAAASAAFELDGFIRIVATSACRVRIGSALTNGSGGESWASGEVDVRAVKAGQVVGVSAAA